ncbi:MAG TPA: hypothetical protein PLV83_00240 [Bacilli bacterium]|nr:hypothetical protein [Bacilli bacterium]
MIKVKFKEMENAYGIKSLSINYNGDKVLYQSLIYSRNGTFKTSFSRTLNNLSRGNIDDIKDRLTDIPSSIKIDFIMEGGIVESNNFQNRFIVFSRELYEKGNIELSNYNQELRLLTIDNDRKESLNLLMSKSIEKINDSLKSKLKNAGLNVENSVNMLTNKSIDSLNINDLEKLLADIKNVDDLDISKINLRNLFQKAYDPIDNDGFKESATNYANIFNKRLNEELFDENFNDSNCISFLQEVKKNNYLSEEKKRGIVLKDEKYFKYDEIDVVFKEAIRNISSDSSVLAANSELVKSMGTSAEAKKLQKQFNEDPLLVNQLALGKRNIVAIALKQQNFEIDEFEKIIKETKNEYSKLIVDAKEKQSDFENAIKIYKNRFNPIFDISISNKVESVLGESVPILSFKHNRNKNKNMSESDLRKILSSGEKTALNIISFIVEYEANKSNNPILVLDDLVETFDYSNRHAFIEYVDDLVKDKVSIIILTHNYEFYRTLERRIPELERLSAYSNEGKVYVEENRKLNNDIEKVFDINNVNQFIYAIPYLREIKTMLKEDTNLLDNCLHYKESTKNIIISDIKKFFPEIKFSGNGADNYLNLIYKLADDVNLSNQYDIIPKTILSIACRLKIEEKIIGDNFKLIENIETNQLSQLKDKYKEELDPIILELIERVQISTPEFIHCNSFMYEPLIDIDGKYLLEIYNDIKNTNNNQIWK